MELEALDGKRLQALDHIMIKKKKKKWPRPTTSESEERILKNGSLFGRWCCSSVLKTKNWGNGLLIRREPFKVHQLLPRNAYWLSSLEGESHKGFIN